MKNKERASDPPPADAARPSRLLSLPLEIRQTILTFALTPLDRHVFSAPKPRKDQAWAQLDRGKMYFCPPILMVCQQLYTECLQVLSRHATFVLYAQPGFLSIPSQYLRPEIMRSLDVTISVAEQRSSFLRSSPTTKIFLPVTLGSLVAQLESTFRHSQSISLTLCTINHSVVPLVSFPARTTVINWRSLLFHPRWRDKVTTIRLQLAERLSSELFTLAGRGSPELIKEALGHAPDLPNLRMVELYLITSICEPVHDRLIRLAATRQPPNSGRTIMSRMLEKERRQIKALSDVLPSVFPQVKTIRLFRSLGFRGTIYHEPIHLDVALEEEATTLLEQRKTLVEQGRDTSTSHPW